MNNKPPPTLRGKDQVAEWNRVTKELNGKLSELDRSLLVDYCNCYINCIDLRDKVGDNLTLVGPKGGEYMNPLVSILMHEQNFLAQLRRDLYFTPKSRQEKRGRTGKGASILESLNAID